MAKKIDYNGVGALRDQRHIPSKHKPKYHPPPGIDIASFNKSLKATWIQKYLDPESRSKWKRLFDSELERNGGEAILKGNLNKKDVNNLKI